MTTIQTNARGITVAEPGTHEHQRRGIQSAVESVQDVLDAWPDDLNRPDVRDAVFCARDALCEAKRRLDASPLKFKGEVVVMAPMGGTS